jgi:hypothetical protein
MRNHCERSDFIGPGRDPSIQKVWEVDPALCPYDIPAVPHSKY